MTFRKWLRTEMGHTQLIIFSIVAVIIEFVIFKILYPYPNFIPPDSFSYIEAAYNNQLINVWAIGYSKFLRFFSCFTSSHLILVQFQYLLLQFSVLYFIFSIGYWLRLSKWMVRLLVGGCIFNPLLLHISNFISSDALFISLSMIWVSQLLWIINSPGRRLLVAHASILLFAFMVRHNALYYPFISILVIVFAHISVREKCVCVGCIILLLGSFATRTMYQYYKQTRTVQYAAFGGWQLAANALYGYAHVSSDPPKMVPAQFRILHTMVNNHIDSIRKLTIRPDDDITFYYLWDNRAPLKEYMSYYWRQGDNADGFIRWATMGNLYSSYGRYLIWHHPIAFINYYIWPNLQKYYVPPVGFMGVYNLGNKTVNPIVGTWFGWDSNVVRTYSKDTRISVVEYFPVSIAINNVLFLISFAGLLFIIGFKRFTYYGHGILSLAGTIWLCNLVFSVFSAPVELRYQIFPMLITFVFNALVITLIVNVVRSVLSGRSIDSSVVLLTRCR